MPPSPPTPPLSLDEVRLIARLLHEADLSEIEIETLAPAASSNDDAEPAPRVRLQLRRGTEPFVMRRAPAPVASAKTPASTAASGATRATDSGEGSSGTGEVLSPTVGIFRAAAPPLQVGDAVQVGQKAGAVESLKIPTDILFPHAGFLAAVLAEDGVGVEYGQVLFRVSAHD